MTTGTNWLTDTEQTAWRAWLYSGFAAIAGIDYDLRARRHGLDFFGYHILVVAHEHAPHGAPIKVIAGTVMQSKQTTGQRVKKMTEQGLLTVTDGTVDKRTTLVHITDAGRDLLASAAPGHVADVRRRIIDLLTSDEIETLAQISKKILDANRHTALPADR